MHVQECQERIEDLDAEKDNLLLSCVSDVRGGAFLLSLVLVMKLDGKTCI